MVLQANSNARSRTTMRLRMVLGVCEVRLPERRNALGVPGDPCSNRKKDITAVINPVFRLNRNIRNTTGRGSPRPLIR